MQWDILCHVIDNWGDLGVTLRLAHALAERGEEVALWATDPAAAAWMRPGGHPRVSVKVWGADLAQALAPRDVLISAFGCTVPEALEARMAACRKPPVWINLEYLSAEGYVARSHGLPSPRASGLTTWFYFPGFTAQTGGLLREGDACAHAAEPGRDALVFAYPDSPFEALPQWLAGQNMQMLAAAGASQAPCLAACNPLAPRALPHVSQAQFDAELRQSRLAIVRGEDSLLRALWAGVPFVWDIYKQHDGAHAAKLDALLAVLLEGAAPPLAEHIAAVWRGWNRLAPLPHELPPLVDWRAQVLSCRERLMRQRDLVTQLLTFVRAHAAR